MFGGNDEAYNQVCDMANKLRKEWSRELYDSMCDLAYENKIDVYIDDDVIQVEDEPFYLKYRMSEC